MARTLDLNKKAAILTAARATFIKDGYGAAKMSDIAAEAGVAPGTLYLYFENKEALAAAIGEELFTRLMEQCGSIIRAIEDPEGIVKLVDWALQIAEQDRVVLAMVKERKEELKAKKLKNRQQFIAGLAEALSELVSRGVIRNYGDTTTLAEMVLSVMRRIIMARAIFEDIDTADLKAGTVSFLQHALFDDVTLTANRLVQRKLEPNR